MAKENKMVFLSGATGFVGGRILSHLLEAGYKVRCLVRERSIKKLKPTGIIQVCPGDVGQNLEGVMEGCRTVIHLVGSTREGKGITFEKLQVEGSRNMVREAQRAGVKHFIQMSALGASPDAPSRYQQTKASADKLLIESGLAYTIFRPPMIYGMHDKALDLFIAFLKISPFVPLLSMGSYYQQLISVQTIADAFVLAVGDRRHRMQIYEAAGPERLTYDQILSIVAEVLGVKAIPIHHPAFLLKPVVRLLWPIPFFPMNPDKIKFLLRDNICDEKPFYQAFKLAPIPLREGLKKYLA